MFEIPAGTNVSDYQSVSIHCRALQCALGYAALKWDYYKRHTDIIILSAPPRGRRDKRYSSYSNTSTLLTLTGFTGLEFSPLALAVTGEVAIASTTSMPLMTRPKMT